MSIRYLYNTSGHYVAFIQGPYVFSPSTEWLGFVRGGNLFYDTKGKFRGHILEDDRVARNRTELRRSDILPLMKPLRPLKPLKPLKRLRVPKLRYPYEDVFEQEVVSTGGGSFGRNKDFDQLEGSSLVAANGVFLGKVSQSKYDADSVSNKYGLYGSPYSDTSIFNKYGKYGSQYENFSPYNKYSSTPPHFSREDKLIAYLTVNQYISPRVDPMAFQSWLDR